ncbi:hypothetical protein GCM10017687_32650 [Streptomyces echinatus]
MCALVGAGLGVSLAPASIRRIRLRGVAFRGTDPGTARTRVAVAWREHDRSPLVAHLPATVSQDPPPDGPWGATRARTPAAAEYAKSTLLNPGFR